MVEVLKYKFIQKIADLPFVEEIWLFGSRARGDNVSRSDIDLAIVCPEATQDDWRKVMDIVEEADTLLKIDCVRVEGLDKTSNFLQNILDSKKILYTVGTNGKKSIQR